MTNVGVVYGFIYHLSASSTSCCLPLSHHHSIQFFFNSQSNAFAWLLKSKSYFLEVDLPFLLFFPLLLSCYWYGYFINYPGPVLSCIRRSCCIIPKRCHNWWGWSQTSQEYWSEETRPVMTIQIAGVLGKSWIYLYCLVAALLRLQCNTCCNRRERNDIFSYLPTWGTHMSTNRSSTGIQA